MKNYSSLHFADSVENDDGFSLTFRFLMHIFIRYCLGTSPVVNFDVPSSITIAELKKILLKKVKSNNEDTDSIWLVHGDSPLDSDQATLADYEIENDSMLEAIKPNSRLFLGAKFVDLNNTQGLKKQIWPTSAPKWRMASRGLCLEGRCKTKGCKAFNHSVIIPIGYKRLDILNDVNGKTSQCPVCYKFVEPSTCGFNNCWWRYQGKKQNEEGEEPQECSSDWRFANDAYHYFDQQTSGLVYWRQLIIETVKDKP